MCFDATSAIDLEFTLKQNVFDEIERRFNHNRILCSKFEGFATRK